MKDIGEKVVSAAGSSRLYGAYQLSKLYKEDIRYRRIGKQNYYAQLMNILFISKKTRRKELGMEP